jgi:hypothetical protein
MPARDRRLLLVLAALAVLLALAQSATGIGADALIAVPGLLLLLPLAAGQYVGEERLARCLPRRAHRRDAVVVVRRRAPRRAAPRGGLLIAVALARRGPPARAAAR